MKHIEKIEKKYNKLIGKTPHDSRLIEITGRKLCALCGHPFKGDKVVEEIRTLLISSHTSFIQNLIQRVEGERGFRLYGHNVIVSQTPNCSEDYANGFTTGFDTTLDTIIKMLKEEISDLTKQENE
jgi:CRISPR/Cas system endoribonuclease Cas6 (RAMP superfamily)